MRESYRVVVPDRYLKTRFVDELLSIGIGADVLLTTDSAVQLLEGDRAPVAYVPRAAIDAADGLSLLPSDTRYQCRWKGEARYFDIQLGSGTIIKDGAWAYQDAPDDIALLRDRVAFDAASFTEIVGQPEARS